MSTRSHIGIRNEDGSLDVIYCHWDGYPSYNGALLLHHYQAPEKIRELIALGDISSLAESVKPAEGEHTFDSSQEGVFFACHIEEAVGWAGESVLDSCGGRMVCWWSHEKSVVVAALCRVCSCVAHV